MEEIIISLATLEDSNQCALIATLEDMLREQNIKYLLSSTDATNETSLQFHKILGFRECGTLDINDDGKREIFLKKELSPFK